MKIRLTRRGHYLRQPQKNAGFANDLATVEAKLFLHFFRKSVLSGRTVLQILIRNDELNLMRKSHVKGPEAQLLKLGLPSA